MNTQEHQAAAARYIEGQTAAPGPDVEVSGHGSIFLVEPKTDAGREWIREHVSGEALWFGRALAVEHRYVANLVDGMINDGLIVE
jgi:hypothetical protein